MKSYFLIPLAALMIASTADAQTRIWRCPNNTYTNNEAEARGSGCKVVEGANVSVVEGTRVNSSNAGPKSSPAGSNGVRIATAGQRVDASEQKARDADARAILESELKKAETRQVELQKEYNNGEPEKLGPEHRNYQKYLDRVAELKASIARTDNDISGIRREISRLGGTVPASR